MFIGRESELKFLRQYYDRKGSQIVVVYGQKGVGKTSLLNFFAQDIKHTYYLARACSAREQRYQWAGELAARGFSLPQYPDYQQLFHCLADAFETEKQLILIDEFHYFVKSDEEFMKELISYVEERGKEHPVMVVLCTSASGWVENSMIGKLGSAALHMNGLLKLRQMKFHEICQLYSEFELQDAICTYAVLGGIPGLWKSFDARASARENIIKQILYKESRLNGAFSEYISSELREPAIYNTLLLAMARGCNKLNDIHKHTGFSRAKISVYLKTLMELDLVEKVFSYEEAGNNSMHANVQKGIYRISNPYVRFYFRFLFPGQSMLEMLSPEEFYEKQVADGFSLFTEEAYRKICAEQYDIGYTNVGEWLGKDGTIDIVAQAAKGETVAVFCSYGRKATIEDYEWLLYCMKKAGISNARLQFYCEKGYDEALLEKADRGEITLSSIRESIRT